MPSTQNVTKLVCLFHTQEQAQNALTDLQQSGLPPASIAVFGGGGNSAQQSLSQLQQLNLPGRDMQMLSEGLTNGGTVILVSAPDELADKAEAIFTAHRADQVDEKMLQATPAAAATTANGAVIPVVEEELVVGKRQVERGAVRVYSRVIETPVEENVVLREEHATVSRTPVNRNVTQADMDALRVQSIEVTEMEEVPVVSKSARVVEEVLVGKESSERTEQISDKVRKTQVDVEQVTAETKGKRKP